MSRNFLALSRTAAPVHSELAATFEAFVEPFGEESCVLALVSAGGSGNLCSEVAFELSAMGRRVMIVSVERLLKMNPILVPDESSFAASDAPNVWFWPTPGTQVFKARSVETSDIWLEILRQQFDVVLLDCPLPERTPAAAGIAAMASKTVLLVQAGENDPREIRNTVATLQTRGASVAGSILIRSSNS